MGLATLESRVGTVVRLLISHKVAQVRFWSGAICVDFVVGSRLAPRGLPGSLVN